MKKTQIKLYKKLNEGVNNTSSFTLSSPSSSTLASIMNTPKSAIPFKSVNQMTVQTPTIAKPQRDPRDSTWWRDMAQRTIDYQNNQIGNLQKSASNYLKQIQALKQQSREKTDSEAPINPKEEKQEKQVTQTLQAIEQLPPDAKDQAKTLANSLMSSGTAKITALAVALAFGTAFVRKKIRQAKANWGYKDNLSESALLQIITLYKEGHISKNNAILALKVLRS